MPTPTHARTPVTRAPDTPTLLARSAELIEELLVPPHTSMLVGLIPTDDHLDIALGQLDGHPVDELLGFEAPADWSALGVAATGRAHTLDPSPDAEALPVRPVHVVHLVARDATACTRVLHPDRGVVVSGAPAAGPVDDVCRRALGLPTPAPAAAPEESVAGLLARWWLDEVLELADRTPGPFTWATVAAAHPLASQLGGDGHQTPTRRGLEVAGHQWVQAHPWCRLHALACAGHDPVAGLSASSARWLDEGSYARWCLALFPELADLVASLASLAPAEVVGTVIETLHGWGLWGPADTPLDSFRPGP